MARADKERRILPIWKRMFQPGSKWEDKDEFLDIIYWGRQVISVIMGIIWGYLGFTGASGILMFVAGNSAAVYFYSVLINEDTEDVMTSVKEGFMTALASFLVSWILVYTGLYYS